MSDNPTTTPTDRRTKVRVALGDHYKKGWIRFRLGRDVTHHIRWAFGVEWQRGFIGILLTEPDTVEWIPYN